MNNTYKVYVKTDSNNNITAINSSAFVDDSWGIYIGEGISDKYHHAQNNYFDKSIMTMQGIYRYKLINGEVVEKTEEEIASEESIIIENNNKLKQIAELKQKLLDSDYVVIKIAEGVATYEEYSEIITQRQAWREEINQLEQELLTQ